MAAIDTCDIESNSHEKRRAERSAVSGRPAKLFQCHDGQVGATLNVKLVDFSPHGAGFLFAEPPIPGHQFLYPLRQQAGTEVYMLYTVVRSTPTPRGHLVGMELTCLIPANELKSSSAPLPDCDVTPIRDAILE